MRIRTAAIATALTAAFGATAGAFAPVPKGEGPLETHASTQPARSYRSIVRTAPASARPALDRIKDAGLGNVLWDRDTDTPTQLWGAGIATPGANANAAVAETAARDFLAQHLGVLAPGAALGDFELVSNVARDDFRAVGFKQRLGAMRVLGGQIGFVFKHDRLIIVSSTALPNVQVSTATHSFKADLVRAGAARWIGDLTHKTPAATAVGDQSVLPIVHRRTKAGPDIEFKVVHPVSVALTDAVGAWDVYVDDATGAPIARKNLIRFATGTISYNVPDRNPQQTRSLHAATGATHTVNGTPATSDGTGHVTWAGGAAATVSPGLTGPKVAVHNSGGATATTSLSLAANGSATWDEAATAEKDAQLTAFIHASLVKNYVKSRIAPGLAWLDGRIDVYVNESGSCNAYSNGDDIHFFPADAQCENTGRIADVIYHEFGHSVHANALIPGVGDFAGDVSEGMSDFLAATITNDHGMGRGFFFDTSPLRDLDPTGQELVYPNDVTGEVHADGEIIGEAMWDLRKALIADPDLGEAGGVALAEKIWYHILEVSTDLPSSFPAALAADDDDGNLANGTPHECAIKEAFGTHGLAESTVDQLGIGRPAVDGLTISVPIQAPTATGNCPAPSVQNGTLQWALRDGGPTSTIDLVGTDLGGGAMSWAATIPTQPDGTVLRYKLNLALSNGNSVLFPDNPADPWYELYIGPVEEIWCDDFEAGADQWTHGMVSGTDEWEVGAPQGLAEDPTEAYDGTNVFGTDLSNNGEYRRGTEQYARTPEIDVTGKTGVRLQYRRWLGVEDGFFDIATIKADGVAKWTNLNSMQGNASNVAHKDHEWRFQDVDLSAEAADGKVQIEFNLASDDGLQFGGWNLDHVCIVAQSASTGGVCGDGAVTGSETCDDGNTTDGDGCSATCVDETGGEEPGGCCQTGSSSGGPLLLGLLTVGAIVRRRRRG